MDYAAHARSERKRQKAEHKQKREAEQKHKNHIANNFKKYRRRMREDLHQLKQDRLAERQARVGAQKAERKAEAHIEEKRREVRDAKLSMLVWDKTSIQ